MASSESAGSGFTLPSTATTASFGTQTPGFDVGGLIQAAPATTEGAASHGPGADSPNPPSHAFTIGSDIGSEPMSDPAVAAMVASVALPVPAAAHSAAPKSYAKVASSRSRSLSTARRTSSPVAFSARAPGRAAFPGALNSDSATMLAGPSSVMNSSDGDVALRAGGLPDTRRGNLSNVGESFQGSGPLAGCGAAGDRPRLQSATVPRAMGQSDPRTPTPNLIETGQPVGGVSNLKASVVAEDTAADQFLHGRSDSSSFPGQGL